MNLRPAAVYVLVAIVVGLGVSKFSCSDSSDSKTGQLVDLPPIVMEGEVRAASDLSGSNPTSDNPAASGSQSLAIATLKEVPPKKPEMPFEFKKELDLWGDLKKRLFLSEADLAEKNRLLTNTALLRALGLRLTEPSVAQSVVESQDAAVDLLVEALKSGDRETASDVLKSVVEDPQIENSAMAPQVREHMAGVKGEIMLRWAALVPEDAANIERSLPGPISKKIWDNVKKRHESNRLDD